jgi:two-component system, OmpR family, heavy metal sensor histidine kinase CusS
MLSADRPPAAHQGRASARNRKPRSLATRLTAWYIVSSFSLVLVSTGILYAALLSGLVHQDDQILFNKMHVVRGLVQALVPNDANIAQEIGEDADAPRQTYVRVQTRDGTILHESPGMATDVHQSLFPAPYPSIDEAQGGTMIWMNGRPLRVVSARLSSRIGTAVPPELVIQVATDVSADENLLAWYRAALIAVVVAALLVCAAAGHQIARVGLSPLRAISHATGKIGTTTLSTRIEVDGLPTELRELALTFNQMLNRLESSFSRLSQFSDDIAHELRTPISNMLVATEVALNRARTVEEYRDILESNLEDSAQLSRMVQSLLFLARADNPGTKIDREIIDVEHELALIHDFYEAAAIESGLKLLKSCDSKLDATVDRTLFQRAISNLVANAIAHTPRGGTVHLSGRDYREFVLVEVSDTGDGIAPDHLPYVFDRFYRVDQTRSTDSGHVGLGLSIVKSVALLHGGSVEIDSVEAKGTCVALRFPKMGTLPPQLQDYEIVNRA